MLIANGKTNQLVWKNTQNRYHVQEHDIPLEHPNVSFSILSGYVGEGSTVLDIACGEGRWGYLLKKKGCKVYGIDIDDSAIHCAAESGAYEVVWKLDIEQTDENSAAYQELIKRSHEFDYIGMLDILEHTVNPTKVMEHVIPLLEEGKTLLVSVPNIGHADIFLNLMEGNFNYQEMGILDNTHTKYFTRRSFLQWIKEMNESGLGFRLDCSYLGGTFSGTEYLDEVARMYPGVYAAVEQNPEFNLVQLFFRLTKTDETGETPELDRLLTEEKAVDLLKLLEGKISADDSLVSALKEHSLSWNQRRVYEERLQLQEMEKKALREQAERLSERFNENKEQLQELKTLYDEQTQALTHSNAEWERSAEGWKEADRQLHAITDALDEKDELLAKAEGEWKRNMEGWEQADRQLQAVLKEKDEKSALLEQAENEWKRNAEGWKQADEQLHSVIQAVKEKEQLLTQAESEWKRNAEGWKQADEQLHSVIQAAKEKEQLLTQAESEWKRNAEGWKQADEQYVRKLNEADADAENARRQIEALKRERDTFKRDRDMARKELDGIHASSLWPLLSKFIK